ncbi:MAG: LysE family transporter [Enhydrobacter sp.]|nr:MAG: LysE family transporter [Enhydrobacter sp.]
MVDTVAILSLLAAAAVVMGSPGPSTVSATAVGATFGLRRALPYVAGLVLGTFAVLLVVEAGMLGLLASVPAAGPVLAVVSAAYILYLAVRIATAPPLSRQDRATAVPGLAAGLALAVVNPKAYLAISAVVAVAPGVGPVLKTALLAAMVVLIHALWLLVGTAFARLLYDPVTSRIANVGLAAVLVASAVLAFA